MRIVHDENVCASTGMCEAVAPDNFEIGDDGALHIHNLTPLADQRELMQAAVDACPTGALSLED
jgi:ferredoxin